MAFLVFEGLDGSGKTSLIQGLADQLKVQGRSWITTREPGGTPLAEEIRHLLLRTENETPVPMTEVLLYEASRAQHVAKVIAPALAQKKWVLCDRFTASTVAFQCGGRGLDRKVIDQLNSIATIGVVPDLFVLLDLTVEESERRREGRKQATGVDDDRFEREAKDFHERVRQSYLAQAKENPKQWIVLNSSLPKEELLLALLKELKGRQWLDS